MRKVIILSVSSIIFISLFLPLNASWESIYKFKSVQIPFNLKYKDLSIIKGKYDLEFLKLTTQIAYFLRIIKKKKFLCTVPGEFVPYKTAKDGSLQFKDPNIPKKPTLRMQQDPEKKLLIIIFESGKKTIKYPYIKLKFKIEYQ
jgi:hypothetical protein